MLRQVRVIEANYATSAMMDAITKCSHELAIAIENKDEKAIRQLSKVHAQITTGMFMVVDVLRHLAIVETKDAPSPKYRKGYTNPQL